MTKALGAPFYARFWRRVGYHASRPPLSLGPERTRISCHAAQDATKCAAFIKESRMKFASATNLYRKSGVAQWRDLRFFSYSHTDSIDLD
jgi:hypothetical protein